MQLLGDPFSVFHHQQPLQLVLGPAVFDGHRGLLGERLDQREIVRPVPPTADHVPHRQGAEGFASYGERDHHHRPDLTDLDQGLVGPDTLGGILQDRGFPRRDDMTGDRPLSGEGHPLEFRSVDAVGDLHDQCLPV
jgi:hypothetical protein